MERREGYLYVLLGRWNGESQSQEFVEIGRIPCCRDDQLQGHDPALCTRNQPRHRLGCEGRKIALGQVGLYLVPLEAQFCLAQLQHLFCRVEPGQRPIDGLTPEEHKVQS
jgi:hypothetical protein